MSLNYDVEVIPMGCIFTSQKMFLSLTVDTMALVMDYYISCVALKYTGHKLHNH